MTRMIDVDLLIAEFEKVYPLATNEMGGVVNKRIYDIINSIPVVQESSPNNPAGDLISRDALRKEVTEKVNFTTVDGHIAYDKMLKLIDNAPTVEEVSVIEFKEPLPLVKAQKIVKTLSKRPQGECRTCIHRDPEDKKCDCGGLERQGCPFPVSDDYFCKFYEKGGVK